ncbi:MAG: hypothetical protein ACYCW6_23270, partial [Candidatus Xenobia bacterium]
MRRLIPIALIGLLLGGSPLVLAQTPSPSASVSKSTQDRGATMRKVLSKMTLSATEKAKTDKILADPTLHGAKRRDAVEAVLTPANLAQFKKLWAAAHHH